MPASKPLDEYTPHELSAGLMRGNRVDMQRGYSPYSAALVAADRNNLSEHDTRALLDWSLGFHDGIWDATRESMAENENYMRGRIDAHTESGFHLYPTEPEEPASVERVKDLSAEQLFSRRAERQ
jgi:hypothetical protein